MGRAQDESRPLEPVQRRSLADDIADRIRSRIFDGTYSPGEKLPPERELARQLKVNRGSLREALKKLQHLGLIRIRQGDGTRVLDFLSNANVDLIKYLFLESPLDRHKLLTDLMEVRTHTCTLIVRLATERASRHDIEKLRDLVQQKRDASDGIGRGEALLFDFEFYEKLAQLSGNIILSLTINSVKPPFFMFRPVLVKLVPALELMFETHEAIIEAMLRGDADAAVEISRSWLERGADLFLEYHKRMRTDEAPGLEPPHHAE